MRMKRNIGVQGIRHGLGSICLTGVTSPLYHRFYYSALVSCIICYKKTVRELKDAIES